ncbi:MAG: glycosyltransferase family 39 protein [Anaerolineae bacterium]|nr:glycosyltransferase family 39 protein [Anaerolineae bacterium]
MNTHTRTRPAHRWPFYAMTLILVLAAYLRIHDLNAQGLWGDEGWSLWLARGDSARDVIMLMVDDHHGPEWQLMLRGWEALVGGSVVALRYLPVLFSVTSVALLYRLGRALFNPAAGVWAALAFTLMDKHVVLTQEVRHYAIVFFFMITIALFYVRWRERPTRANALGYVLFSVLGVYLHYYCTLVNLAIGLHALITLRDRQQWTRFIIHNTAIVAAFAPWLMVAIMQYIQTPVDDTVLTTLGWPFDRKTLDIMSVDMLGTPVALNGLLLLVGTVGPFFNVPGPMRRIPRPRRMASTLLVALWFALPIVISVAFHKRYPLLTDRNIAFILPAAALLIGFGLTAFERFGRAWIIVLIVVNGLGTTSSFFLKPPWREMAADIAANYPAGEPVLLDVEGAHGALWYQLKLALPDENPDTILAKPVEHADKVVSLYDYRKRYGYFFLPNVKAWIDQTDGLWMPYWGDEFKKHDVIDLLALEGFVRTGTLTYHHHDSTIYAHRYDRLSSLETPLAVFSTPDKSAAVELCKIALPDHAAPGANASIQLWWHADTPPPVDYSVSVFLLDESGQLRAQHDGFPANGSAPTSQWTPDRFIFDGHVLALPGSLPPGTYTVGVKLYTWWDGVVLPTTGGADYVTAGTITITG